MISTSSAAVTIHISLPGSRTHPLEAEFAKMMTKARILRSSQLIRSRVKVLSLQKYVC